MPQALSLLDFDAVLFDVDGTLVDSLEMITRGLGDTYERFLGRRPSRERIRGLIGMPLSSQLRLFGDGEPDPEQVSAMTDYAIERFSIHKDLMTPIAPAIETLRLCHSQGIKTALVTSKSTVELTDFLSRFQGAPYVHATVCASDVVHPKPEPESALLACRKTGTVPSRAVMIGDSVYDVRCAKAAGVATVAVAYGAADAEALSAESPDLLFQTPHEVLAWAESAFLEPTCRGRS